MENILKEMFNVPNNSFLKGGDYFGNFQASAKNFEKAMNAQNKNVSNLSALMKETTDNARKLSEACTTVVDNFVSESGKSLKDYPYDKELSAQASYFINTVTKVVEKQMSDAKEINDIVTTAAEKSFTITNKSLQTNLEFLTEVLDTFGFKPENKTIVKTPSKDNSK